MGVGTSMRNLRTSANSPRTASCQNDLQCLPASSTLGQLTPLCPSREATQPTPGSWLLSGEGLCESLDYGPETLPELTDEQFEHVSTDTAAGRRPTVASAAGPHQCTPSKATVKSKRFPSSCKVLGASIVTAGSTKHKVEPSEPVQIQGSEAASELPHQLLEESPVRRSITDVVISVAATVDASAARRRLADNVGTVDLAPTMLPGASRRPHSLTAYHSACATGWMPMFAGTANESSSEMSAASDAEMTAKATGQSAHSAEAPDSPCSQALARCSWGSRSEISQPGHKRKMPCPPLPRRPSFGAIASAGHETPVRSMQFSPEVVSPNVGRSRSLGSSPPALQPLNTSAAPTTPLLNAVVSSSCVSRPVRCTVLDMAQEPLLPELGNALVPGDRQDTTGQSFNRCVATSFAAGSDGDGAVIQVRCEACNQMMSK